MIKPLPIKLEGETFSIDDGEMPVELECHARYLESIKLYGQPNAPRGIAYINGGAIFTCYMRQSTVPGAGFTHRHQLFADPRSMFPWTDPFTKETYDMVKRAESQP